MASVDSEWNPNTSQHLQVLSLPWPRPCPLLPRLRPSSAGLLDTPGTFLPQTSPLAIPQPERPALGLLLEIVELLFYPQLLPLPFSVPLLFSPPLHRQMCPEGAWRWLGVGWMARGWVGGHGRQWFSHGSSSTFCLWLTPKSCQVTPWFCFLLTEIWPELNQWNKRNSTDNRKPHRECLPETWSLCPPIPRACSVVSDSLWAYGLWPTRLLSAGFPRQEHWSGLPFPSPGDLPNSGIEPASPTSPPLAGRFFTTSATWVFVSLGLFGIISTA